MNSLDPRPPKQKENAQGMVEFALVLPLLLLLIFGIIEFGRLLFVYSAVFSASRNAVRYGSAAGDIGDSTPHYLDCAGIQAAADRTGNLVSIQPVVIRYDHGSSATRYANVCPPGQEVSLGDRIEVEVTANYQPIVPIVNIPAFTIRSRTARTIMKDIAIQGTPPSPTGGQPTVIFDKANESLQEDSAGTVILRVQLSSITAKTVQVPFAVGGSAAQGSDYSLTPSGQVDVPAGSSSAIISIAVDPDTMDEEDETVVITMGVPVNAVRGVPNVYTLTIVDDDDPPTVSFANNAQSGEEDAGEMYVVAQLSAISGKDVTVPYTVGGTALPVLDYTIDDSPLIIPAGSQSNFITVTPENDELAEDNETVILNMGMPVNATQGAITIHSVVIEDSDTPPIVTFTTVEQLVNETQGSVTVTALMNVQSVKTVTVPVSLTGTAEEGTDYAISTKTITFAPGSAKVDITITIYQNDDGGSEADETIILTMGTPTNAVLGNPSEQTITITHLPTVWFSQASQSVAESAGLVSVVVQMWPAQGQDVVVPYSTGGTATRGDVTKDYTLAGNSVTIPSGQTSATINLLVNDDLIDENDETVVLTLSSPPNILRASPYVHVATIIDNDLPAVVSFLTASQSITETNTTLAIPLQLSAISNKVITVPFNLSGTAIQDTDYSLLTPANYQVTFPVGQQVAQITFNLFNDLLPEGNESFMIALGTPTNASLGTPATHTVTIVDDEPVCEIFDANELSIDQNGQIISWSLANADPTQKLFLHSLTVNWPTNSPVAPKFDYTKFGSNIIWDGNVPGSPATINSSGWSGLRSWRELTAGGNTVTLGFTRTLLPGDYILSLTFYNDTLGVTCPPVTKSGNLSN